MDDRTIAGLVATFVVAALTTLGVYGFATGYLIDSSEYVASTIGALVVATLTVGALIVLGAGSRRWRENPYW